MMKSVRLFNANTLFKVSLAMIVMVAALYVIGFLAGSAAGKATEKTQTTAQRPQRKMTILHIPPLTQCAVLSALQVRY